MPMLWKLKELVFLRKYTAFHRKKDKLEKQIKDDVINETDVLHEDSTEKQIRDSNNKYRNVNDTHFYFIDTKNKKSDETKTPEENEALQSTSLYKDRQTLNELDLQDQEVTPFKPANYDVFGEEAICENKLESSTVLLEPYSLFTGDDTKHRNKTENLGSQSDVLAQTEEGDIDHKKILRNDKLASSGNTLVNNTILGNNKNHTVINHTVPEDVGADLTGTKDNEEFVTTTGEENETTITTRATPEPTNMTENGRLIFSDNTLVKDPLHDDNKSRYSDTKTSEKSKDLQSKNLIKDRQTLNKIDLEHQDVTLLELSASTDEEPICEKKSDSSTSLSEFSPLLIGDNNERKNETENFHSPSKVPAQTEYQEINHLEKLQSDGILFGCKEPTKYTFIENNKNHTLINQNIPKEDVGADLIGTKGNEEFATITSEENRTTITTGAIPEPTNMTENGGLIFSDNTLVKHPLHGDNKSHYSDSKTSEKSKDLQSKNLIKDRQTLNKIDLEHQDVTLLELSASIDEEPICEKKSYSSPSLSEFSPLLIGDNNKRKNETENFHSPSEVPAQTEYQEINHLEKLQSDGIIFRCKEPTKYTFIENNKNHTLINQNIPNEDTSADLSGTEENEEFVSTTSQENRKTITRVIPEPTNIVENGGVAFGDNTLVQDHILGDNKNQNVPKQFIITEDLGTDLTENKNMEESVTITNKEKGTTITIRAITEPTNLGQQTKQSNMKYDDYIIIKDAEKPNNTTRVTNDVLENAQGNISTEVLTTISKNMAAESIKNENPIKSSTDNNFSLSLEQNSNLMNEDPRDLTSRSKNPDKQNQDTKNVNSSDDRSQQDGIEDIYDIVEITELATQKLDEDSKNVAEITSTKDKAEHFLPSSKENTSEVETFLESLDTDPYNIIDISDIISPSVMPETKET